MPAPAVDTDAPRFVIAGTGRSGSGYIAAVLTHAGIRCGHESFYNPLGEREVGLVGDSSWCAVPHLDAYHGFKFFQFRHPLRVIESLLREPLWGPYLDLAESLVAHRTFPFAPLHRATAYVTVLAENAHHRASERWRLEDVDWALVERIAHLIGVRVPIEAAVAAVGEVPKDFNSHGDSEPWLGWDDIPNDDFGVRLRALAAEYDYA